MEVKTRSLGVFEIFTTRTTYRDEKLDTDRLEQAMKQAMSRGVKNICVDFSNVPGIEDVTVNLLKRMNRELLHATGRLAVLSTDSRVTAALDDTGVSTFLRIYQSEDEISADSKEILRQTESYYVGNIKQVDTSILNIDLSSVLADEPKPREKAPPPRREPEPPPRREPENRREEPRPEPPRPSVKKEEEGSGFISKSDFDFLFGDDDKSKKAPPPQRREPEPPPRREPEPPPRRMAEPPPPPRREEYRPEPPRRPEPVIRKHEPEPEDLLDTVEEKKYEPEKPREKPQAPIPQQVPIIKKEAIRQDDEEEARPPLRKIDPRPTPKARMEEEAGRPVRRPEPPRRAEPEPAEGGEPSPRPVYRKPGVAPTSRSADADFPAQPVKSDDDEIAPKKKNPALIALLIAVPLILAAAGLLYFSGAIPGGEDENPPQKYTAVKPEPAPTPAPIPEPVAPAPPEVAPAEPPKEAEAALAPEPAREAVKPARKPEYKALPPAPKPAPKPVAKPAPAPVPRQAVKPAPPPPPPPAPAAKPAPAPVQPPPPPQQAVKPAPPPPPPPAPAAKPAPAPSTPADDVNKEIEAFLNDEDTPPAKPAAKPAPVPAAPPPAPAAQPESPASSGEGGMASIFISSSPPTAEILENGKLIGTANRQAVMLSAGKHTLLLRKGSIEKEVEVEIAEGKNKPLFIKLR